MIRTLCRRAVAARRPARDARGLVRRVRWATVIGRPVGRFWGLLVAAAILWNRFREHPAPSPARAPEREPRDDDRTADRVVTAVEQFVDDGGAEDLLLDLCCIALRHVVREVSGAGVVTPAEKDPARP